MRRIAYLFLIIITGVMLLYWTGCGSSRKSTGQGGAVSGQSSQEDFDEIEKLLGISRDDKKPVQTQQKQPEKATPQKSQPAQQQDDLLTLLEADEGKKTDKTVAATTAPVEDQRIIRLQNQVTQLENDLRKKDMEIADLKAQIMLKDEALQKQASSAPVQSGYTATPARSAGYSAPVSSDDFSRQYADAKALFDDRQYQSAINAFQKLLESDMNHSLSDNAQYWIGECYYALGRYREAIMAFETVLTFPQSNKNDYAHFKLGQCYTKLGETSQARLAFQELIDTYPNSELVSRARNYLAQN